MTIKYLIVRDIVESLGIFELANNIAQRDGVCVSIFSPIDTNSYLSQASEASDIFGC